MSVLDRVVKFASNLLTEAQPGPMGDVDRDDDQYRRLTQSNRDITPALLLRSSKLASFLYQRNPIARRIIDITAEYVLGEGVTVSADDDKVDALVKRFWNHPVNAWKVKGIDRFRDLRLYGEVLWKVTKTPGMGTVILEPIDVQYIDAVMWDTFDNPVAVVYRRFLGQLDYPGGTGASRETLMCINLDAAKDSIGPATIDPTRIPLTPTLDTPGGVTPVTPSGGSPEAPLFTEPSGECFYFAINRAGGTTRGISDLFPLMDYLDAADQFMWTMMERARIASAMVYDITVNGADESAVAQEIKRIKQFNPTRPGGVNVHSDTVSWQILAPQLSAADTETQMRAVMRVVLGGAGFPEYMFADAANTNRASASEQGDPVVRRMTSIQSHWLSILDTLLRYQYQEAIAKGENLPKLSLEDPVPWNVNTPDLSTKDLAKIGNVLTSVTSALAEGEVQEYISKDTARRAYLALCQLLGVKSDPQEEADKIKAQPKKQLTDYHPDVLNKMAGQLDKANPQADGAPAPKPGAKTEGEIVAEGIAAALAAQPKPGDTHVTVEPAKAPDVRVAGATVNVQPAAPARVDIRQPITVQPAAPAAVNIAGDTINVQPAKTEVTAQIVESGPRRTETFIDYDKDHNPIHKVEEAK